MPDANMVVKASSLAVMFWMTIGGVDGFRCTVGIYNRHIAQAIRAIISNAPWIDAAHIVLFPSAATPRYQGENRL